MSVLAIYNLIESLSDRERNELFNRLGLVHEKELLKDKSIITEMLIDAMQTYEENNKSLTVEECAELLQVSDQTIRSHIKLGKIKAILVGCKYSIPKIQFKDKLYIPDC